MSLTKKNIGLLVGAILFMFATANIISYFAIMRFVGVSIYSGIPYAEAKDKFSKKSAEGFAGQHFIHPFFGTANANWKMYENKLSPEPLFHHISPLIGNEHVKVLVVGGSVAAHLSAGGLPGVEESLFARVLNQHFKTNKFVVYNAAFGGGKQPQQYFKYLYLDLLGFKPDVVINLDGLNEIALTLIENKQLGNPAIFPRQFSQAVNVIATDRSCAKLNNRLLDVDSKIPLIEFGVWAYVKNCHYKITGYDTKSWWLDAMHIDEKTDYLNQAIAVWRESSNRLQEVLSTKHIDYIHVLQANQYLGGSKEFTDEEKRVALNSQNWAAAIGENYSLLDKSGLSNKHFMDQRFLFKNVKETVYADSCCHFNQKGMSIIVGDIIDNNESIFQKALRRVEVRK